MTRYTIMIVTNPDYGDPEILIFPDDEITPILTLPLPPDGMIHDVVAVLALHGYRTTPPHDLPNRGDHWTTTSFGAVATATAVATAHRR